MTNEFRHYDGCRGDVDNCSACALTDTKQDAPNYAAWPLAYLENGRAVPAKWRAAFNAELARTDNLLYVENVKAKMAQHGLRFTDGRDLAGQLVGAVSQARTGLHGMTQARWDALSAAERDRLRSDSGLTKQLIGLEGWRVEIESEMTGEKRRFIVGRSSGWIPCHIELRNRTSRGGMSADSRYKTVRAIAKIR